MTKKRFGGMKTHIVFSAIFILLLLIDRLTKQWASSALMQGDIPVIDDVLVFHYLENRGAAWGFFENAFWLFYIITAVAVVIMAFFYAKIPFEKRYLPLRTLLIVLCAGAVGNFIDRAFYHYVVDFIYFKPIDFPVFNVADIYVTLSVLIIVILLFFVYDKDEHLWNKKGRDDDSNR